MSWRLTRLTVEGDGEYNSGGFAKVSRIFAVEDGFFDRAVPFDKQ